MRRSTCKLAVRDGKFELAERQNFPAFSVSSGQEDARKF
jgi:hypothetical protein